MNNVCVFCGSSPGARPVYVEAARRLGEVLVERGLGLVYGGAQVGLMGVVADAVLASGGQVFGVIPTFLSSTEVAHPRITELRIVGSMHERKALMAERADAFVALPGGFGTLDEIFEILTWAQLGLHEKPCGLLNVAGYFDGLLAFLDNAMREGFLKPDYRQLLVSADGPEELVNALRGYRRTQGEGVLTSPDQT